MRWSWVVLAATGACRPTDPEPPTDAPPDTVPTGDTAGSPATDTGTPPGTHSGGTTTPALCEAEQETTSGALIDGWRSPSGTLYAIARSSSARVRAPDGTWSLDASNPAMIDALAVHGVDDDHVWAATPTAVLRREPGGAWVDAGLPPGDGLVRGVHVRGPDEVLVLRVDEQDAGVHTSFWRWNGADWASARGPDLNVDFGGWGVTSDGWPVIGDHAGLVLPTGARVPFDVTLEVHTVAVAADDTIVVAGNDPEWHAKIAVGTLAGMAVLAPSPGTPYAWLDAWAESADDVWVAYNDQVRRADERYEYPAVVLHWDGAALTTVVPGDPSGALRFADGGPHRVFALGGHEVELALLGDPSGLRPDREAVAPGRLHRPVVDDVTGEVWSTTFSGDPDGLPEDGRWYTTGPVLARFADGAWTAVRLPEPSLRALELGASDGRMVIRTQASDERPIWRYEGGELTQDALPEDTFAESVAAADGVLFAGARRGVGPTAAPVVLRHAGAGWEALGAEGLPATGVVQALWADGADELWAAVAGGLYHWEGGSWTLAATYGDASTPASHLRRSSDGALYLQVDDAAAGWVAWRYDGTGAVVPDLPEGWVDDLEVTPSGEAYAAVATPPSNPFSFEVLVTRILRRDAPGGPWVELATQERLDVPWPIVARGPEVWVALETDRAWSRARCP